MTHSRPGRSARRLPPLAGLAVLAAGMLLLAPSDARAQCTAPDFKLPPMTIDVSDGPRGVAVLDVKRDGSLDVVTADELSNTVTFAFGDGMGGLTGTLSQSVGAGTGPWAVTVADFDRDGFDDVAVANRTSGTLQAVLLDAAGAVKTPLPAPVFVAPLPNALVAGDFDRNGIPDLVSASNNGTVEFFRGNGNGTFTPNPPVSQVVVAGTPQDILAGDFNRDGRLDAAVLTQNSPANPNVHVVLGDGNGGWLGVNSFPFALAGGGLRPIALAAGDVDNDGDLDVVSAESATSFGIAVLLGDGLGNLAPQPSFLGSWTTTSLVLADFGGDGMLDLGVARESANGVSVFTGDGLGGFGNRRDFSFAPLTDEPRGLAAGDFDNDGRPDLAGSSRLTDKAVLLVNAYNPVCPAVSYARAGRLQVPLPGGNPATIASGDWDGDAVPDLAVASNSELSILMGNGTLRFGAPTSIGVPFTNTPNDRRSLAVADFNLDSRPDLATVNPTSGAFNDDALSVLLNAGGGTFAAPLFVPVGVNPWGVVAGDFNGDGAPDLVSADRGGPSLTFVPGGGDGTFGAPTVTALTLGGVTAIAAADIDGDLVLDVAVAHTSPNALRWYRGNGLGSFTLAGTHPVGNFPRSVDLGDLNGDGRPDLVAANSLGDDVSVLLNTGGTFVAQTLYAAGDEPDWIRIGFADSDGDRDLVVANRSSHTITVLLNDGSGAFPTSTTVLGYDRPAAALLVDVDRNTRPDLGVTNSNLAGGVYVLPGDGAGGFGPVQVSPGVGIGGNRSVASGDFNRDGLPDLVTLETSSFTDISFLKGQGDGTFAPPVTFPTGQSSPQGLGIGDFDKNGRLDAVVGGTGSSVSFLAGDGLGGFAVPVVIPSATSGSSLFGIAVGDFDRDGNLDFTRTTLLSVTTHYGDGTGAFPVELSTSLVGTSQNAVIVLDFNRDGILDLAVSSSSTNAVLLLEGRGARLSPPFTRRLPDLSTDALPRGLAAGDVNHDGVMDLVVGHLSATPGKLGYFRGLIAASPPFFGAREDYGLGDTAGVDAEGVRLADVNADGWLDALVACRGGLNEDRPSVRVLTGTGDPTPGLAFNAADVWAVAQKNPSQIGVDDFNRDGRADFFTAEVLPGTGRNSVSVVLNSNCLSRRLRPSRNVSLCNTPSTPFGTQPAIQIEDDGANPIQCDTDAVAASIIPGTGTPGANLLGTTPLAPTNGVADWSTLVGGSQLSIDTAGKKYRLEFTHPKAGLTYSRTFSVSPSLAISGPSSFCATSTGFFSTDTGFDTYRWYVDGAGPASWAPSLTVGPLGAGPHTIQVNATADTCPAGANQPFDVFNDLTNVSVAPGGPFSVCSSCTGATLTATDTGGGAVTRKWAYRPSSGSGPLSYIAGESGASYVIDGSDFPGEGTYYLVEETTPQCGVPTISNEVEVQVTTTTAADQVPVFTVRSTSQLNRLEWVYPSGSGTVAIRYNASPTWAGCSPPANVSSGLADIPDQSGSPGGKGLLDHSISLLLPLVNGTTYCYSIFAELSPGVYAVNTRSVKGRPFDTSGAVKWAFSVGTSTLEPPGLGSGVLHIVSNDEFLYAMGKGAAGGSWPAGWTPFKATGPSQSRPVSVPIAVGPASQVIYLGSQAMAGNNALAVDAATGLGLWGQPLGASVQAGPAGIFTSFGGSLDAILLGTYDTVNPNAFHARDPVAGNSLGGAWPYPGEPPGNEIGIVSSQAAVDYLGDRVFFTSYQRAPGTSDSVWCLDLASAGRCPLWPPGVTAPLGNIAASPTLRGSRLYVSPIVGANGEVQALDADNGAALWTPPFQPADGQIKLFMVPDFALPDLYFSTTNSVWAITDAGTSANLKWQRATIPNPSQPVFFAGTGRVYVGGGDGQLYVLNASNGLDLVPPITLGEPAFAQAGAPTVDQAGGFVYLGTDAGVVFAVTIP